MQRAQEHLETRKKPKPRNRKLFVYVLPIKAHHFHSHFELEKIVHAGFHSGNESKQHQIKRLHHNERENRTGKEIHQCWFFIGFYCKKNIFW